MTPHQFGLLCAAAVLVAFAWQPIRDVFAQRRRNRVSAERIAAWKIDFDAKNPPGPPLSRAEIDGFIDRVRDRTLPGNALVPDLDLPIRADGNRLGGPVALPSDTPWPLDRQGAAMAFVAQIDFGSMPPLPGFPASGLVQVFVGSDDLSGANFDDPRLSDIRIIWQPSPAANAALTPSPILSEFSPLSRRAIERGVALTAAPFAQLPTQSDWQLTQAIDGWYRRPGIEKIDAFLDSEELNPPRHHQVGGHPVFTQDDCRRAGHLDDYDRVLLRVTSDDHVMWGDVGEAVFLIRSRDLSARDFSRVAFSWDCS